MISNEEIRVVQKVLLNAIVDLFAYPPVEVGAYEDIHLHLWQIEKMLELTDSMLAELDEKTKLKLAELESKEK